MNKETDNLLTIICFQLSVALLLLLSISCHVTHAEEIKEPKYKIAVIDTGYDRRHAAGPVKICPTGSYDFATNREEVGSSEEKHGTYIASIIGYILRDVDYCVYVFQVYGPNSEMATDNVLNALTRARKLGVVAVNLSFRSGFYDWREHRALQQLANAGVVIFSAAGNEARDLNVECDVYPACYEVENMIVAGALTADGDVKASYSNYGSKVNRWYSGVYTTETVTARGTSFSAPKALGYYVRYLSQQTKAAAKHQ